MLTDEVRLEPTPGHTPGHSSVGITSGGSIAVITGDMIHDAIQFPRPEFTAGADVDSDAAVATPREAFERWTNEDVLVIGSRFAGRGAGRLRAEGDAWRLG